MLKRTMMIAAAGLLTGAAAVALTPDETPVRIGVTHGLGAFGSVETLRVVEARRDPQGPLGSGILLEITGSYEGNICGDDTVALEPVPVAGAPLDAPVADVRLRSLALGSGAVALEKPACPDLSRPRDFRARLALDIAEWPAGAARKTWTFRFRNTDWTVATLVVRFDVAGGWSASLDEHDD